MLDLKPARTVAVGDNGGPTFDEVVRENLEFGIWLSCVKSMSAAMQDMRVTRMQLRIFGHLIDFLNAQTGVAFPGRKVLAERSGYSEGAVARSISELIGLGYIVSTRRQPQTGGRALAHYALARPSIEEMRMEITKFTAEKKAARRANWKPDWQANEHTVVNARIGNEHPVVNGHNEVNGYNGVANRVGNGHNAVNNNPSNGHTAVNVTNGVNVQDGVAARHPDEHNGVFYSKADEHNGGATVTGKKEVSKKERAEQSAPLSEVAKTTAEGKALAEKLYAAGGHGLANPAGAMGLLHLGIPMMWLDSGCDLERDILPTIQAKCAVVVAKGGRPIGSWSYFTGAVSDAKAARERGLPPPTIAGAQSGESTTDRWKRMLKSTGVTP